MTASFALVRSWFAAFNNDDLVSLLEAYAENAVWDGEGGPLHGATRIRERLAVHFHEWEAALDNGARRRVRTIGQIESGIAAEWVARERHRETGQVLATTGYAHFSIVGGRIESHREVTQSVSGEASVGEPRPSSRSYPERPVVGVGGVIVQDGRVVLIKRRYEPLAGQWSLPGGTLELGETLAAAVTREMLEETGLEVEVGPVIEVFDRILMDPDERVRYHFVLIDYLCRPVGGLLRAGSDVADAVFVEPADLPKYRMTTKATAIAARGVVMASECAGF